jgi:hypothetical protein
LSSAQRISPTSRPEDQPDLVVDVDPGHVLVAARDRPSDPELEGDEHLLQHAALGVEQKAAAVDHEADAGSLDLPRGRLPLDGDLGAESLARRSGLVDDVLPAVAVVADRRLADEDGGLALQRGDRLHEVAGRGHAALADPSLRLVGPALVDRLPDQVDDAVDLLEGGRGRALHRRLPLVPAHLGVAAPGLLGVAGEPRHLVAAGQQRVADGGADRPARACHENPHGNGVPAGQPAGTSTAVKVPVSALNRAMPPRRASSTTAAATAGATSRLKTLGMM